LKSVKGRRGKGGRHTNTGEYSKVKRIGRWYNMWMVFIKRPRTTVI